MYVYNMYSMRLDGVILFEWDDGNRKKIFEKHGITSAEIEEIFLDRSLFVLPDIKHSQVEPRYIAVGKGFDEKRLHVVFTMRGIKIRAISARRMHRKEMSRYEKIKKDTTF